MGGNDLMVIFASSPKAKILDTLWHTPRPAYIEQTQGVTDPREIEAVDRLVVDGEAEATAWDAGVRRVTLPPDPE